MGASLEAVIVDKLTSKRNPKEGKEALEFLPIKRYEPSELGRVPPLPCCQEDKL